MLCDVDVGTVLEYRFWMRWAANCNGTVRPYRAAGQRVTRALLLTDRETVPTIGHVHSTSPGSGDYPCRCVMLTRSIESVSFYAGVSLLRLAAAGTSGMSTNAAK